MKIISKIRNIILTVVNEASLVSRESGHWYGNGAMYAKHIVALGLGSGLQPSAIIVGRSMIPAKSMN